VPGVVIERVVFQVIVSVAKPVFNVLSFCLLSGWLATSSDISLLSGCDRLGTAVYHLNQKCEAPPDFRREYEMKID
jgi:hypothetical protein